MSFEVSTARNKIFEDGTRAVLADLGEEIFFKEVYFGAGQHEESQKQNVLEHVAFEMGSWCTLILR